ncbi:MAG: hypothetical protein GF401_11400 [Chitinivibrionales bacterium]|nr:hypothetical protein [Chitinivibrionales bacterium]
MNSKTSIHQHHISKSLLLHLLPGILTGACYFSLMPVAHSRGYPSIMALMIAVALVLIPFYAGISVLSGEKEKFAGLWESGVVSYFFANPVAVVALGALRALFGFLSVTGTGAYYRCWSNSNISIT